MSVLDLTHTISGEMPVYPGTEKPVLTTACTIETAGYRETLLHMYSHTGTHMDAPAHMIARGRTLDSYGVEKFVGPGFVLDCRGRQEIPLALLRAHEEDIRRQTAQVEEFEKLERRRIPVDADYADIQGLRLEAREKLSAIRPQNLGQASRISGVSPADIAALMIWLHARGKDGEA